MTASINFAADGTVVTTAWLKDANTSLYTSVRNALLYGITGDGVTDDTAAINTLLALGGYIYFPKPTSFYKVTTTLTPVSNSVIFGAGVQSLIKMSSGDINIFTLTSLNNVVIKDLGLQATAAGTTQVAGINMTTCTDCVVDHVDFNGLSYYGVWLQGTSLRNTITKNNFRLWQGTNQNAAEIYVMGSQGIGSPSLNTIAGNFCFAGTGAAFGISILDPYSVPAQNPTKNSVEGNFVGTHSTYGIIVYLPNVAASFTSSINGTLLTVASGLTGTLAVGQDVVGAIGQPYGRIVSFGTGVGGLGTYNLSVSNGVIGSAPMTSSTQVNSYNRVVANHVDDILGSFATNRDSGAGIYVVGAGSGGTVVGFNTVRNCCVNTLTESLTPGGIGINGTVSGNAAIVVEGNVIAEMSQFHGIVVAGGNCIVKGNSVLGPATNATGLPIKVNTANNVVVSGNIVTNLNTSGAGAGCIGLISTGINTNNVSIMDNQIVGGNRGQITIQQAGGFAVSDLVVSNNRLSGIGTTGNASISFESAAVTGAVVVGNTSNSNTVPALLVVSATNVRYTGNHFYSSGATSVNFSGTNTNSNYDTSNDQNGVWSITGTGLRAEFLVSAVPATGTAIIGTRAESTTGVVGQPKAWRCTVAASPGTWVSEGNL